MIGLGIGSSAIREIAQTQETQKKRRIAKITQNLALLLSIAGLIVTVISAYPLSKVMFGDSHHILGFFVIAIAVFNIFSTGYDACLKGFHATKKTSPSFCIFSNIKCHFIFLFYFTFMGLSLFQQLSPLMQCLYLF